MVEPRYRVAELTPEQELSYAEVEEELAATRGQQRLRVQVLQSVQNEQAGLRQALDKELGQLRTLSAELSAAPVEQDWWQKLTRHVASLFATEEDSPRSIEQILRQQYERSSIRLRQAAELADRLEQVQAELYDEVDELNARCIASAQFEDEATAQLLSYQAERQELERKIQDGIAAKTESRQARARADHLRRKMAELSTQIRLHQTRDERSTRLKHGTELLGQTVANLATDMRRYVSAASTKLDSVATQIQAIGAAADASVVRV